MVAELTEKSWTYSCHPLVNDTGIFEPRLPIPYIYKSNKKKKKERKLNQYVKMSSGEIFYPVY